MQFTKLVFKCITLRRVTDLLVLALFVVASVQGTRCYLEWCQLSDRLHSLRVVEEYRKQWRTDTSDAVRDIRDQYASLLADAAQDIGRARIGVQHAGETAIAQKKKVDRLSSAYRELLDLAKSKDIEIPKNLLEPLPHESEGEMR
ncbi:MAG: hypothetical protein J5J00_11930 [Deltaproteobacteria bacterium]|nr:hypothetical protein [Deltaproteobacteria bacterium]